MKTDELTSLKAFLLERAGATAKPRSFFTSPNYATKQIDRVLKQLVNEKLMRLVEFPDGLYYEATEAGDAYSWEHEAKRSAARKEESERAHRAAIAEHDGEPRQRRCDTLAQELENWQPSAAEPAMVGVSDSACVLAHKDAYDKILNAVSERPLQLKEVRALFEESPRWVNERLKEMKADGKIHHKKKMGGYFNPQISYKL